MYKKIKYTKNIIYYMLKNINAFTVLRINYCSICIINICKEQLLFIRGDISYQDKDDPRIRCVPLKESEEYKCIVIKKLIVQ